ncbi:CTP synthase [Pseudomonas sp. CDFA 602]|uniref:CTP synthase C-terminal region-related (seleno)protein n=1 Tax=Pseudomonas californiensis TaxID=2829823 RepID=UPI001E56F3E1|nr:CTP synthase [Pseudomonas californiensis]MCD5992727.1 CTP synthase [Pseudomonas californiensis]MCD5998607.1 CTP synthase [Pseudomonas californiensis]
MDVVKGNGRAVSIGLVGDFDGQTTAHQAIPLALHKVAEAAQLALHFEWLPTRQIGSGEQLSRFDGLWAVPATPYQDMAGALAAIRHAREQQVPFLGTCGGFQHALLEYARHCLGWTDAEHGESAPDAANVIIAPLSCSMVDVEASIQLLPDTLIAEAYGTLSVYEGYHCRYGLRQGLEPLLFGGALKVSGRDADGDVRSMELQGHPFFVATLFQPERAALRAKVPALVAAFVQACLVRRGDAS